MNKIWLFFYILEIVLYLLLIVYVRKLRSSIDNIDSDEIKKNFNIVTVMIYSITSLTYFTFVSKFFVTEHSKDSSYNKYRGIKYVSLSLVLVLLVFHQQLKIVMKDCYERAVPIETINVKFKNLESLAYVLSVFVLTSKFLKFLSLKMVKK